MLSCSLLLLLLQVPRSVARKIPPLPHPPKPHRWSEHDFPYSELSNLGAKLNFDFPSPPLLWSRHSVSLWSLRASNWQDRRPKHRARLVHRDL